MAHLEGTYEQVNERLGSIESRLNTQFAAIDGRFTAVDARFVALDRKIDDVYRALDGKIDQRFMWTIGIVVGTWLTTLATILLHR